MEQWRRIGLVLDVLISLDAEDVDHLLLRQYFLGDAGLRQEHRQGVGHITFLHQVRDQTNCQFESEAVLRIT